MDKLLDINPIEILFVLATITLLLVVLDKLFFKPIGGVIKEREEKIKADSNTLQSMFEQINEKTEQIEQELRMAKRDAGKLKEELINEGETVRDKIIEETRNKAKNLMDEKMKELDEKVSNAEKKLRKEIASFSDKIKEKFL
jgi:F-type H+-transporting ATPase subunit b